MRDKQPFYITDRKPAFSRVGRPIKKEKPQNTEIDKINAIGSWVVKVIAISGMLGLAFYYDGQWIPVAIGACILLLGIELRYIWIKRQNGNNGGN